MKNLQQMKIVALLPMKANSSRIKAKNFREFHGLPLFRWILDTLQEVNEIDQIVINTDARTTLLKMGLIETNRIIIRDRKPEISGDHVSMNLVLADDVANVDADIYVMTHTTNPLISAQTIRNALHQFAYSSAEGKCDSLFSVNKVQSRFYQADVTPLNHNPKKLIPTQELDPWYEENSNIYIFTAQSFAATTARIGCRPIMFETPPLESIDIDTPDDWELALIAQYFLKNH